MTGQYRILPRPRIPWQIFVVSTVLGLYGIGDLLDFLQNCQPAPGIWLLAKCFFITGLLRRWWWMYIVYLTVGTVHVLVFSIDAPVVAMINLILVLLVASTYRFYFPPAAHQSPV
jgi:hypothetical protein